MASISFINHGNNNISVYGVSTWCYNCLEHYIDNVTAGVEGDNIYISTVAFPYKLSFYNQSSFSLLSSVMFNLFEGGSYTLTLNNNNEATLDAISEPSIMSSLSPAFYAIAILIGVYTACILLKHVFDTLRNNNKSKEIKDPIVETTDINTHPLLDEVEDGQNVHINNKSVSSNNRLASLDSFRGFCLTFMIFVNYGGGGYWFLSHSPWNGLTFADLLFPWFIWIMGLSLAISTESAIKKGFSHGYLAKKLLIRSFKLIAIGLFLNNGFNLSSWRLPGVLQYFGISGCIIGLLGIYLVSPLLRHLCVSLLLIMYICIQTFLPLHYVNDELYGDYTCPTGYIGPGGVSDLGLYPHCTGGAHRYIDVKVFGYNHMYHWSKDNVIKSSATCNTLYDCDVYDPEGLLGTLTACVLCYFGFVAGRVLLDAEALKKTQQLSHTFYCVVLPRFMVLASIMLIIAVSLAGLNNDGVFPLNKNLWSVSFVFFTGGLGLIILSIFFLIIDIKGYWSGAPFIYPGMNSIVIYTASEMLGIYFPFSYQHDDSHSATVICNVISVILYIAIAYIMYEKKLFIKL